MNTINPQAIAASKGRPLTESEIGVLMAEMSRRAKTQPKRFHESKPKGPALRMEFIEHVGVKTPTMDIATAADLNRSCTVKALKVLAEAGHIVRIDGKGHSFLWSRVDGGEGK